MLCSVLSARDSDSQPETLPDHSAKKKEAITLKSCAELFDRPNACTIGLRFEENGCVR